MKNHKETFKKYVQIVTDRTLKEKRDKLDKDLLIQPYILRPEQRDQAELELEIINEEILKRKNEAKK